MKNIIDYVLTQQEPFTQRAFCAVDSLVLSELCYRDFRGIVPGLAQEPITISIGDLMDGKREDRLLNTSVRDKETRRRMLQALGQSKRFRDVKLLYYIDQTDEAKGMQFSVITFLLGDGTAYIAYRGTDYSVVGLKEDFNLACVDPIPSQIEGLAYLNDVALRLDVDLRLGGHSKGGNVAIYSAMWCNDGVRRRIRNIYSHDGPGFHDEVYRSERYIAVKDRIHQTMPQSSLVGMFMQQHGEYDVVESEGFWFMQHDPFAWTTQDGDFAYAQKLKLSARYVNVTMNDWISKYDNEMRELFIEALFEIIQATNVKSLAELAQDWRAKVMAARSAMKDLDQQTRRHIRKALSALIVMSIKSIPKLPQRSFEALRA